MSSFPGIEQTGPVWAEWHRAYCHRFTWLIMLVVGHGHGFGGGGHASGYPQAIAVVDDFGTLVVVGEWS